MPTDRHGNRRRLVYLVAHRGLFFADRRPRASKRSRRAQHRRTIQQIRKLRRRGECPCGHDVILRVPGPVDHLASCAGARHDYDEGNPF